MVDNVMTYIRKPVSVVVAALMAALLVPVVPQMPQALAKDTQAASSDFVGTADANGFIVSGILNNHAAGDVTFEQAFTGDQVKKAFGGDALEKLAKPDVAASDETLMKAAQAAAEAAVSKDAKADAEANAKADLATKTAGWDADAQKAAEGQAKDLFEGAAYQTVAKEKALKQATEKLEKDDPSATDPSVELKKNPDSSFAMQVTLGDPTWTASAVDVLVEKGSVVAAFNAEGLTWSFGDDFQLAFGTVGSTDPLVAKDTTAGKSDARTIQVLKEGTTELSVPFTYNWLVAGASYSYTYAYSYGYTPHYSFDAGSYTYEYVCTYKDSEGNSQTFDDVVRDASLGDDKLIGDEAGQSDIEVPSASGEGVFECSYDPQTGKEPLADAYTYNLEVTNLFAEASLEARTHSFEGVASESNFGSFTYHDPAKTIDAFAPGDFADDASALGFLGEPTIGTTNGFEVAYDAAVGKLTVTPKNATAPEGEDVTVTWTLPDETAITHTVHAVVNKLTIEYDAIEQPFRLLGSQEEHVLKVANDNVRATIKGATTNDDGTFDEITADYYGSAQLNSYDGQGSAKQDPSVAFEINNAAANTFANYEIVDLESVGVLAMETLSWGKTELTLSAKNGTTPVTLSSENATTQWINTIPEAAWEKHGLAYATKGVPADKEAFTSSTLSGGDGTHGVEMYGMDGDGIVCEVTGITYMLDTQAPILTGAQASAPQKAATFGSILFGDTFVKVDLSVVDEAKQNKKDSQDPLTVVKASGVKSPETKAWYTDDENGQADIKADLQGEAPLYSFTIQGDKDVSTSSIKVQAVDNAGNVLDTTADKSRDIPIEYSRLVADASKPEIDIVWDTYQAYNGHYYNTNRTMTLTINEEFFNYVVDYMNDQVITTVSQDGQAVIAVHPSDFTEVSKNVWQYTLSFTVDADWDVTTPTIYDIVGRSASVEGDTFTVDKTTPTMDVSFDNNNAANGNYYNAARTATLTVTEHNFSGDLINITPSANAGNGDTTGSPSISGWTSAGDVHTATVTFPGEGVYSMTADGADLATNVLASYSCPEFVVDTIKPTITIEGIENANAYPASIPAQPGVAVHDTNIGASPTCSVKQVGYSVLKGTQSAEDNNVYEATAQASTTATDYTKTYANPSHEVDNDGVYTMVVEVSDLAGNTDNKAVTWSVNRFGSTYVVSAPTSKMLNEYLQTKSLQDVEVTEINPSGVADDSKIAVELTKDTSNKTLTKDQDYRLSSAEPNGWYEYTYTVGKNNFNADGMYRVLFHSEDKAGNKSENTMQGKSDDRTRAVELSFVVDDTAPICGFVGLQNGGIYEEISHQASVSIDDNLKLDHAEIKVNGEKVSELNAEALKGSDVHAFELTESPDKQQVEVVAYDAAGNNSETLVATEILVTTNPFLLWWNNKLLVIATIVGGIALIALAATGITFFVRKRKASLPSTSKAA